MAVDFANYDLRIGRGASDQFDGDAGALLDLDYFTPASGGEAQALLTPLLSSTTILYAPTIALGAGGAQSLSVGLHTNTNILYGPAVAPQPITLAPALLTSSAISYTPTVATQPVTLACPLLASLTNLHAPTVAAQPVTLGAPLLGGNAAIHSPTVSLSAGGLQTLLPSLLANGGGLFTPMVLAAPAVLQPGLYSNTQTFYTATITIGPANLAPALLASVSVLYPPTVGDTSIPNTPTPADRFPYQSALQPTMGRYVADPTISRMAQRMRRPKRW